MSCLHAVPTTSPVVDMTTRALDAITVVEAAKMLGLPIPYDVSIRLHGLSALVHTYDELVTWAAHMSVELERHDIALPDGRYHFHATGTVAGAEVTVATLAHDGTDR